jgi:hypothetical protein
MPQLMFLIGTPMNKKPSDSPKPLFWSAVISSTLPWTTSSGAVYVFFEGDSLARSHGRGACGDQIQRLSHDAGSSRPPRRMSGPVSRSAL